MVVLANYLRTTATNFLAQKKNPANCQLVSRIGNSKYERFVDNMSNLNQIPQMCRILRIEFTIHIRQSWKLAGNWLLL